VRTCTKKYVPLIPKGRIVLPNLLPVSSSSSNSFISETFARSQIFQIEEDTEAYGNTSQNLVC
jgi:hypothetical protein